MSEILYCPMRFAKCQRMQHCSVHLWPTNADLRMDRENPTDIIDDGSQLYNSFNLFLDRSWTIFQPWEAELAFSPDRHLRSDRLSPGKKMEYSQNNTRKRQWWGGRGNLKMTVNQVKRQTIHLNHFRIMGFSFSRSCSYTGQLENRFNTTTWIDGCFSGRAYSYSESGTKAVTNAASW